MNYFVAIKKQEYTAKFCFETEAERQEFIEVTKQMDSQIEFLLSEEDKKEGRPAFQAFTA